MSDLSIATTRALIDELARRTGEISRKNRERLIRLGLVTDWEMFQWAANYRALISMRTTSCVAEADVLAGLAHVEVEGLAAMTREREKSPPALDGSAMGRHLPVGHLS